MTSAKAKRLYDSYYHQQVQAFVKALQDKAETGEEKQAIWDTCLGGGKSCKKIYAMLTGGTAMSSKDTGGV